MENILLCMLADERKDIRQLACSKILKSRSEIRAGIRRFIIPELNFEAEDYIDLIKWDDVEVTEPPLTKSWLQEKFKEVAEAGAGLEETILKLPCHTQAVERCIKLVTEASQSVYGEKARDGFIRARIQSRNIMPKFEKKSDFSL